MKKIFNRIRWTVHVLFSLVGGTVMYCVDEQESFFEMGKDEHLVRNLSVSILSVFIFLAFGRYTSTWSARLVPFGRRTLRYYLCCCTVQFILGGAALLLFGIGLSAAIVYLNTGEWIGNTTYFHVEFYIVLLGTLCLQLVYALLHFFISLTWAEEPISVETVYDDATEVEEDAIRLLEEVSHYRQSLLLQGIPIPQISTLCDESLDRVAYIYSYRKLRYIRLLDGGELLYEGDTLVELMKKLPTEDFFLAGRHLIVSRTAIRSVRRLSNYKLELVLHPPFGQKCSLSEEMTKAFKSWYKSGDRKPVD